MSLTISNITIQICFIIILTGHFYVMEGAFMVSWGHCYRNIK